MTEFSIRKDEQSQVSLLTCVSFISININKIQASKTMKARKTRKKNEGT